MKKPPSHGAIIKEVVVSAFFNVSILRARSIFAVLGIAIGTAAVIAMLHIGSNAKSEALRQFQTMGTDLINIMPRTEVISSDKTPDSVISGLLDSAPIVAASPIIQTGGSLKLQNETIALSVIAAGDTVYKIGRIDISAGRRHSDFDSSALFGVLGSDIAAQLAPTADRNALIGKTALIDTHPITIIGIAAPQHNNPVLSIDVNRSVIIPFGAAPRLMADSKVTSIAAQMAQGADDRSVARQIKAFFQEKHFGMWVEVMMARQIIDGLEKQMTVYAWLLMGIGAVSLVVGGVGIMNVMMMSILERFQEIGLRRALGATRFHIKVLILTEALLFSFSGSAIGIVLGTCAGWCFAWVSGWIFSPSSAGLPAALAMAFLVVLFFGTYPAVRASKVEPIEALRSM